MNETTLREALKSIPRYVLDGPEGAEEYVPTPDGDLIFADDLDAALARADAPDDTLDAAWKEAEAALPDGWLGPSVYQKPNGSWVAYAVKHSLARPMPVTVYADTALLALTALAEKLETGR